MLGRPYSQPSAPGFVRALEAHGARVALVDNDGELGYAALARRVDDLADRLGGHRRLVLVGAANTVPAVVAYLGALRGGHAVLLVADDDEHAVADMSRRFDVDSVLTSATGWAPRDRRPGTAHRLHPDLALLLSTSGSTGSAKLVRLSGANLSANAASVAESLAIGPDDRALTTLPLSYCYGLSVLHSHLHMGGSLSLTGESVLDDGLWDRFRRTRATNFAGVPHTFELLDRIGFATMELPTLRYVTQAGGRLDPDAVQRYARLGRQRGWQFVVMYGQTEATARMAYLPPSRTLDHPGAVGVAVPGGRFELDPVVGCDEGVGELVYHGPNVMLGYATAPADLALGRTVDALRTGDLARRTEDGLYELVGRRNRFVKHFGLRIDLDEVERRVAETTGLAARCSGDDHRIVVALPTGPAGGPAAGRPGPATAHVDLVTAQLAGRLRIPPARLRVVTVGEIPRTANGKTDYPAILALAGTDADTDADSGTDLAGPGDDRAVHRCFAAALGVDPADDDTFVGLGGCSLSYVELSVGLEELLGELPADWPTTPVGVLAAAVPTGRRRRRWRATTDTTVALRAVAIVLVVTTHTGLLYLPGGAHTMLAVAGYNFARFQARHGRRWAAVARLAAPCMLWIGAVAALSDGYRWPHVLLVNAQLGGRNDDWAYWFVETLVQLLAATALLLAVPAVRRLESRRPFGFALAVTAAGLALRFAEVAPQQMQNMRALNLLWLFGLGWAAARAVSTRQRLLVGALVAVLVPTFFTSRERDVVVTVAVLVLLWLPTVPVPRPLPRVLATLAGASLAIYLTHWVLFPPLLRRGGPGVATAGCLAAGVVTWIVLRRVTTAAAPALGTVRRLATSTIAAASASPATVGRRSSVTSLREAACPAESPAAPAAAPPGERSLTAVTSSV